MKRLTVFIVALILSSNLFCGDLKVTFDDSIENRIISAFVKMYGYSDTIENPNNPGEQIDNPESKKQFTKRMIAAFVKDVVVSYEAISEGENARKGAENKAKNEININ